MVLIMRSKEDSSRILRLGFGSFLPHLVSFSMSLPVIGDPESLNTYIYFSHYTRSQATSVGVI